jgi:hypothetical protein
MAHWTDEFPQFKLGDDGSSYSAIGGSLSQNKCKAAILSFSQRRLFFERCENFAFELFEKCKKNVSESLACIFLWLDKILWWMQQ